MTDREDDPLDRLRELIEALADDDGPFDVSVDYDVSLGLGSDRDDRRHPANRSRHTSHPRFGGAGAGEDDGESRTVDVEDLPEGTYHVAVEEGEDRIEVRADLPGVDEADLSVDIEGGDVLVVVDGETVRRVPTEWAAGTVEEITFNNGVLFVGLEPTTGPADDANEDQMTGHDDANGEDAPDDPTDGGGETDE